MPIIRASEVREYTYCAYAWWLRRAQGLQPDNHDHLARGHKLHARHGATVQASNILLVLAGVLLLAAIAVYMIGTPFI